MGNRGASVSQKLPGVHFFGHLHSFSRRYPQNTRKVLASERSAGGLETPQNSPLEAGKERFPARRCNARYLTLARWRYSYVSGALQ